MRSLVLVLIPLLALCGCERRADPASKRTLALDRCRIPGVDAQVRCGTYEVFEDREAKQGRKLKLSVAVVPALAAQAEPDPLFILAGGPGQAASDVAPVLLPALERIRRKRDIVFLDQRGTGKSARLECDLTPKDVGLQDRLSAEFDPKAVTLCRQTLEKDHDLRLYGTTIAMEDLDEVRRALGYDRINLWGGSYGTRAALVYLRQHPEAVRSAILDGVAPMALYLPQDMATDAQRSLELLFKACAEDAQCNQRYPRLSERFNELLEKLAAEPARVQLPHPTTGAAAEVRISRDAFVRILRALLYRPEVTSLVPLTVDRALAGDWRAFVSQAAMIDNGFAEGLAAGMFFSVVCTEDVPFIDFDQARARAMNTFVGAGFADDVDKACALWPRGQVPKGFRDAVQSNLPVLLLSGDLDPVTPPRWGDEAKKHLPNSVHVTVPGTGHGTLGNACVRRLMEQFLDQGSVQGLSARCDTATRMPFFTSFAGPPP